MTCSGRVRLEWQGEHEARLDAYEPWSVIAQAFSPADDERHTDLLGDVHSKENGCASRMRPVHSPVLRVELVSAGQTHEHVARELVRRANASTRRRVEGGVRCR